MPHSRARWVLPKLKKKLAYFPVVAIQGARQTGKSFIAREYLRKIYPLSYYLSFDSLSIQGAAARAPQTFLSTYQNNQGHPVIIDEAQKVPDIFDAVKYDVDQDRRPAKYVLLGSTEFSKLSLIRESLTGRMGRIRVFPLTLIETLGLDKKIQDLDRRQTMQYLSSGGMPGMFSVRDHEARESMIQDWLDLICLRDIHQFKTLKLDHELAYRLLQLAARLEEPTRAAFVKETKVDPRRIETHLNVLCELFVLQKINPHPSGTGKPIYLLLDAGIAEYLGASLERKLHIWLMLERMAKNAYSNEKRKNFYYYRSTGKRTIHWVEENASGELEAFQLFENEKVRLIDSELMLAFLKKNRDALGRVYAPIFEKQIVKAVDFYPWEEIASSPDSKVKGELDSLNHLFF